ncbi:hypothetical protein H7Y29_02015 [Microbacteriaceae bacterium]|nr:hypothetical protein [Candidatus Saccharibacteria bacterium]
MWELVQKLTHGRLSLRRTPLVATLILAVLVATITSTPAAAADAARSGKTVSYDGKTFTEIDLKKTPTPDKLPSSLPGGTSGYQYIDSSANKTYFILTSGTPGQANTGQYVYYDGLPTTSFSNPSPPVKVTIVNGPAAAANGKTSSCNSSVTGGIGWILCPVVNFIASGMDHLYDILSGFLEVRAIQTDTNSPLYRMWAVVRDIANICFVIAFLVIVYSQVSSIGVSNYNVKRMLPRLIAAAILVNISFWISSLAVDVSNLLGYSIHDLIMGVFKSLNKSDAYSGIESLSWSNVATALLSGGAIVGGLGAYAHFVVLGTGLSGSLILLIPILVGVLIAVLVALLVIAVRQALIVCLVIISPLAFVAYLLPNTEKYFDKWKSLFLTMLLLFPIFSGIFGISQLAGLAIIQNASGPNAFNLIILGMAVMVAPVVITPMLIKLSGTLIGRIANMVNNPKRGVMDRTKNWAQGRSQEEKAKILAGKGRNSWANRSTQSIDRRRRSREGWKKANEMIADTQFSGTNQGVALEAASRQNNNEKQRIDNAFGRTAVGRQVEFDSRRYNSDKQRVENEFNDSSLGHRSDTDRRTVDLSKHRVESDHEANWNNAVRTDANLLTQSLAARSSETRAGMEKAKVDRLNAEITALGDSVDFTATIPGISSSDQAGLLKIARDINKDSSVENYTSMAKSIADQKHNSVLNEIMLKNTMTIDGKTTREYAAGIGSQDDVLATAVAKDRREFGEAAGYQKELSSHFKLNAGEIQKLAMDPTVVITKTDDAGNVHEFHGANMYTHDMAAEELFTVGSHGQKMELLMTTGVGQPNFSNRRTIQQAAIKSNISSIAPAIADKTLDDIINGKFVGEDSWKYHSFRQILEGRIKTNSLANANAESLKLLFADRTSPEYSAQFDKLVEDNVNATMAATPGANRATVRQELIDKFDEKRDQVRRMSVQVLQNTTIRQSANDQSVDELKQFAGGLYTGD